MEEEDTSIIQQLRRLGLSFWQWPPVIFAIMIVVTLGVTFFVSSQFILGIREAVLIVAILGVFYLLFGYFIFSSFRKMVEAQRMEEQMYFLTSKQLKAPLQGLEDAAQFLEKEMRPDERVRSHISEIQDSTRKMKRAVDFFLQIREFEKGEAEIELESFKLGDLIRSEIEDFNELVRDTGFDLILEIPSNLPRARGNRDKVGIVIQNYIDNAVKYSPAGGRITIKVERRQDEIKFSVSDQGIGISEKDKKFVFKKYFRASNAKGIIGKGTGMGLYISKLIIEACGGEVGFESEKDAGSEFWFTLPASR